MGVEQLDVVEGQVTAAAVHPVLTRPGRGAPAGDAARGARSYVTGTLARSELWPSPWTRSARLSSPAAAPSTPWPWPANRTGAQHPCRATDSAARRSSRGQGERSLWVLPRGRARRAAWIRRCRPPKGAVRSLRREMEWGAYLRFVVASRHRAPFRRPRWRPSDRLDDGQLGSGTAP